MIKVIVFDLDGTLVNTEFLKGKSYAETINSLTKNTISVESVIQVYEKYVGSSRKTVLNNLMHDYKDVLQESNSELSLSSIKKKLLDERLKVYDKLINNPQVIKSNIFTDVLALLNKVSHIGYPLALATMSEKDHTYSLLKAMNIDDKFKLILTAGDVSNGKPNPEIYLKISSFFNVKGEDCLVIEDSVNGIKSALVAGMKVIAVPSDITRNSVIASNLLSKEFIVDKHKDLIKKAEQMLL